MAVRGRVIVVGSSNTDLIVSADRLPAAGETVIGGALQILAGGKGANQAVAAARAGARVIFLGAFGDDAFGTARKADLVHEGIDVAGCVTVRKSPSGVALICVGREGENQIVVSPGANLRLTPRDVLKGLPRDLNGQDLVLASLEVPVAAVEAAFRQAAKVGATTLLNPAPCPSPEILEPLLELTDWLIPNQKEKTALFGSGEVAPRRMGQWLRTKPGVRTLVETQGAAGASISTILLGEVETTCWPAPAVTAIDTVGAGDCFCGAVCAGLTLGIEATDLAYAMAAASLKVTRHGVQSAMPRRREILRRLREQQARE